MPPLLGSTDGPDYVHDAAPARRHAESLIRTTDAASPLGTLASREDLRERTIQAVQRVLEAGRATPGGSRTEKRIRRYAAVRQELTSARYDAAAEWRAGARSPQVIGALRKLRGQVATAYDALAATPEGLIAEKQDDVRRYIHELQESRFAVTPSRETALDALLEAVVQGRPVLMLGPSGTGKTTLVQELARRLGVELEVIPGNEVTAGQLWGTRGLDPVKGDVIRDGIVARAMIDGKLLLWDEANASDEAMEKFLKFKAYLTRRGGDLVRVPAEHPELRRISPKFAFVLTGNPKGQKHTNRAEFPPEVARELGEVRLDYLPEDELFDLCLAHLANGETLPLGIEEVRADGVLHNLVKFVHEVQNLYLGESAARGVAGAPSLRKLVIDPGMVTAWLTGWGYARADRGESLASYLDRQLVALANSEKYPAEDRALVVQTAARFHFLGTGVARNALHVPGLAAGALSAFTPFSPTLYSMDRELTTTLRDAIGAHPYVERRLEAHFTRALSALAEKTGRAPAELQAALIGGTMAERLQELQTLAAAPAEELAAALPPRQDPAPAETTSGSSERATTVPDRPVDLARETWSVAEMKAWLQTTHDRFGNTLESRLEGGSFDACIADYEDSFGDGPFGFQFDRSKIEIPVTPDYLQRLKDGLECGAINGVIVEAYPTGGQVPTMVEKAGGTLGRFFGSPVSPQKIAEVLDMPAWEFLAKHFEKRGGKLYDRADRLTHWNTMRSFPKPPRNPSVPLWRTFHDEGATAIVPPTAWTKNGSRTPEFNLLQKAVYQNALAAPVRLREVLGDARLTFAYVGQNVQRDTKILGADGVTTLEQGNGLTFVRLLQEKVDTLTPAEFLALTATADPEDITTYPDQVGWEWIAAIDETYAAHAYSASVGLFLGWNDPDFSNSNFRVRSVVR